MCPHGPAEAIVYNEFNGVQAIDIRLNSRSGFYYGTKENIPVLCLLEKVPEARTNTREDLKSL